MPPDFDAELERVLAETLLYLQREEGLIYPEEESRSMLCLYLELEGPEARSRFLTTKLFMRGQFLAACSDLNKYYFQNTHSGEPLTLKGLIEQWTECPTREGSAASKYRTRTLVPNAL